MLRVLGSLIALMFLGAVVGAGLGFYGYHAYTEPGPLAENKTYMIDKGLGTPAIAARLAEQGIIANASVFAAGAYMTGAHSRLKAGEYEFPAHASMQEVMALITSGKSIVYKLTIPEGWTSEMAAARINANEVLIGDPVSAPPEGSILPDTYVFHRGETRAQVLADMQALQARLVNELWLAHRPDIPLKSPEEAVTLASIVEKETAKPDERPLIASVFLNRLAKRMRLQSDPTIIYGIAGGKGRLDRKLTHTDVVTPTPYNTYTIDGLPPGPIGNPGRAALAAVMNPPDSNYLYFVADGSGGHAFSSTLNEHNKNVAKWRDIAGNAAAAADAEDAPTSDSASPPANDQTSEPAPAGNEQAQPIPLPQTAANSSAESSSTTKAASAQPAPSASAAPAVAPSGAAAPATSAEPAADTPEPPLLQLKPGSVIRSGDTLIPVPLQRPEH